MSENIIQFSLRDSLSLNSKRFGITAITSLISGLIITLKILEIIPEYNYRVSIYIYSIFSPILGVSFILLVIYLFIFCLRFGNLKHVHPKVEVFAKFVPISIISGTIILINSTFYSAFSISDHSFYYIPRIFALIGSLLFSLGWIFLAVTIKQLSSIDYYNYKSKYFKFMGLSSSTIFFIILIDTVGRKIIAINNSYLDCPTPTYCRIRLSSSYYEKAVILNYWFIIVIILAISSLILLSFVFSNDIKRMTKTVDIIYREKRIKQIKIKVISAGKTLSIALSITLFSAFLLAFLYHRKWGDLMNSWDSQFISILQLSVQIGVSFITAIVYFIYFMNKFTQYVEIFPKLRKSISNVRNLIYLGILFLIISQIPIWLYLSLGTLSTYIFGVVLLVGAQILFLTGSLGIYRVFNKISILGFLKQKENKSWFFTLSLSILVFYTLISRLLRIVAFYSLTELVCSLRCFHRMTEIYDIFLNKMYSADLVIFTIISTLVMIGIFLITRTLVKVNESEEIKDKEITPQGLVEKYAKNLYNFAYSIIITGLGFILLGVLFEINFDSWETEISAKLLFGCLAGLILLFTLIFLFTISMNIRKIAEEFLISIKTGKIAMYLISGGTILLLSGFFTNIFFYVDEPTFLASRFLIMISLVLLGVGFLFLDETTMSLIKSHSEKYRKRHNFTVFIPQLVFIVFLLFDTFYRRSIEKIHTQGSLEYIESIQPLNIANFIIIIIVLIFFYYGLRQISHDLTLTNIKEVSLREINGKIETTQIIYSPSQNIFCTKCGSSIEPESNFCNFCGEKIV